MHSARLVYKLILRARETVARSPTKCRTLHRKLRAKSLCIRTPMIFQWSFTHWTMSSWSKIILTHDMTNHPLQTQNAMGLVSGASLENSQDGGTDRLTRFKNHFGQEIALD